PLIGTRRVAAPAAANFDAASRVTINAQRFDSIHGREVVVDAVWSVRGPKGAARSGRTVAREAVPDSSFDALAAAHSRALAKVSEDIAAAIRAEAAGRS